MLKSLAITLALLGAPSSITAAPSDGDLVVEGRKREALQEFVQALTDADRTRQLARWNRAICPSIVGVDEGQAALIEQNIARVAESLGLQAYPQGCPTTMLIVFDNEAQAIGAALAKNQTVFLGQQGRDRLIDFAETKNPVRWISLSDPCGFGGCTLTGSRLSKSERPAINMMLVLVDGQEIGAFGLNEISDYLSMVVLGNPVLGEAWPNTSILSMFSRKREDQPFLLTDNDRAYLTGLYTSRTDATGPIQRRSIVQKMTNSDDAAGEQSE
tara:strand:- start:45 stop:857 length:813 start_codon:yes stop_codon:yes gene_type:complete